MMKSLISCLVLAFASAGDVAFQRALDVYGWNLGARSEASQQMKMIISLKNRNMKQLEQEVFAVSSPDSPRYGQHLTSAEIAAMTAPSQAAQDGVVDWLAASGIKTTPSRWGDRLEFEASIAEIEQLFSTTVRQLSDGHDSVPQAGDLHAPEDVAVSISAVFGLHGIPQAHSPVHISDPDENGGFKVTPDLLRSTYNIKGGPEVSRGTKNKRAVAEFVGQFAKQEDLTAFFKEYVPSAKEGDEKYTCVPGHCEPEDREHAGTETMLDVEYMMGTVPGIKTEVWLFSGKQFCTDLKNWTSAAVDHDDPPQVFSVSYGLQLNATEGGIKSGCSLQLIESIDDDFAKMAARGISIIFASGDDGAGGSWFAKEKLWPSWPAVSPFVTAVGGTEFIWGSAGAERSVKKYGSGGGFDWRIPQQTWQKEAVAGYLAQKHAGLPREADWNRGGRASPELAALGVNYQVIINKDTLNVGGTSASAPFFASLVSLLNEERIQQGKSPLGLLNPLIYEMGKAGKGFKDVTEGSNRIDMMGLHTREGYSCTPGWDPVTGFGTPDYQDIRSYVQTLPSGQRSESEVVVV